MNNSPSPYPLNHLQGDLMVDNDLNIGGRQQVMQNARFKRDVIIEGTLYCRQCQSTDAPGENEAQTLETEISEDTKNSQKPATTEAIFNAIDSVQGDVDVNTQDIAALESRVSTLEAASGTTPQPSTGSSGGNTSSDEDEEAADETLYPEYYGAVGDGINYYDWPLRCYNGEVSLQPNEIESSTYPQKVFAPSERIAFRYSGMPAFISTDQVYFNTVTRQFVLGVVDNGVTHYYSKWGAAAGWNSSWGDDYALWAQYCGSSAEWNDEGDLSVTGVTLREGTGCARTDVVFSDISPNPSSPGKLRRVTSVFKNGALVDIRDTMTSDETAFYACLRATKGNMRLHKDKIYFINRTTTFAENSTAPFYGYSDFVLDGQGGVVFAWGAGTVAYNGQTGGSDNGSVLTLYNCERGVIRRLHMRTLRDRDNGAPSGHRRFSSSCGRRMAFNLRGTGSRDWYCRELTFEDVTFKGFYEDFDIRGSNVENILIEGYHSREVCQNFISGAKNVTIRHFDVVQNGYCGDGMHLIYGSSGLTGMTLDDGVMRSDAPWTSVLCTYHGYTNVEDEEVDDETGTVTSVTTMVRPADIHYHNVRLYASRIAQGGSGSERPQWQHFHDCLLVQDWDRLLTASGTWARNVSGLLIGSGVNFELDGCRLVLSGARLMDYNNETWMTLIMRNCGIRSRDVFGDNSSMALIAGFRGTLVTDGVHVDWAGPTGVDFTRTSSAIDRDLTEASSTALSLARRHDSVLFDVDVSNADSGLAADRYKRDPEVDDQYYATDTQTLYTCLSAGVKGAWLIYGRSDHFTAGDFHGEVTMVFSAVESVTVRVDAGGVTSLTELYHAIGAAFAAAGHRVSYPGDTNQEHYGVLVYAKWPYPMDASVSRIWGSGTTGTSTLQLGAGASWQRETGVAPEWEDTPAEGLMTRVERLSDGLSANASDIAELGQKVAVAAAGQASLPAGLEVGYTYFDETAGKPLWLASIAQDNTLNWVDATGTPYLVSGGQVGV